MWSTLPPPFTFGIERRQVHLAWASVGSLGNSVLEVLEAKLGKLVSQVVVRLAAVWLGAAVSAGMGGRNLAIGIVSFLAFASLVSSVGAAVQTLKTFRFKSGGVLVLAGGSAGMSRWRSGVKGCRGRLWRVLELGHQVFEDELS